MNLLPGAFDFQDKLTVNQLNTFKDLVKYDDFGDFEGYRSFDYISEVVDQVLKEPLGEGALASYVGGIKRIKRIQEFSKAKKELKLVSSGNDADLNKIIYGTIDENTIITQDSIFETTETIDKKESIKDSINNFNQLKDEFRRLESVDLDILLVRALDGVPKAVETLVNLVKKYKFLGTIIEDVLSAKELGYDVLAKVD